MEFILDVYYNNAIRQPADCFLSLKARLAGRAGLTLLYY